MQISKRISIQFKVSVYSLLVILITFSSFAGASFLFEKINTAVELFLCNNILIKLYETSYQIHGVPWF